MITTVIYSHTDYIDLLDIQTHYIEDITNKILLINANTQNLQHLYDKYDTVIFYDDRLPYADRILTLSQIDVDYILLIHDIDILISKDINIINKIYKFTKERNIDRIDLQVNDFSAYPENNVEYILKTEDRSIELIRQRTGYLYNVNPSIWKLSTLIDIVSVFRGSSYRVIETEPTQRYCQYKGYRIYKLNSENIYRCGYFSCVDFFTFIHITHRGKLLSVDSPRLEDTIRRVYVDIINKYNLIDNPRGFNSP